MADRVTEVTVAKAEVIRPYLEKTMKELLGVDELVVWDDGVIPLRSGSAGVYVRLAEPNNRPLVHVYSPLLGGVPQTPGLLQKLNQINATAYQARVFWVEDQVVVAVDLLAEALDKEELKAAVDLVSGFADRWDTELRAGFGGQTTFEEATPGPPDGVPELPPPPGSASAEDPPAPLGATGDEPDDGAARGYL